MTHTHTFLASVVDPFIKNNISSRVVYSLYKLLCEDCVLDVCSFKINKLLRKQYTSMSIVAKCSCYVTWHNCLKRFIYISCRYVNKRTYVLWQE